MMGVSAILRDFVNFRVCLPQEGGNRVDGIAFALRIGAFGAAAEFADPFLSRSAFHG